MNTKIVATQTVTLSARGHVLEIAAFYDAANAEAYKRTARNWALVRNVPLQVLTQLCPQDHWLDEPLAPCLAFAS